VFEIQPEESLTIHQRVHLIALVGSLAGFVDLKADVARCPKHVLSDLGRRLCWPVHQTSMASETDRSPVLDIVMKSLLLLLDFTLVQLVMISY
jgi:hypothetical protein